MSEFKFNCPVCGQHIASDSTASGAQIECPTCFQAIIVPQAPLAQSKFILSATQYIKPPPAARLPTVPSGGPRRTGFVPGIFTALFFVCILGVAAYFLHSVASRPKPNPDPNNSPGGSNASSWQMHLGEVSYPPDVAAGKVHSKEFACERAFLQRGTLALQKGPAHEPDLVVNIYFAVREAWELAGKRFLIETNDTGALPRVVLRWKQDDLHVAQIFTNGYAMKLEFGSPSSERLLGRIYLCVPDASQSYVAGSFAADIRKP